VNWSTGKFGQAGEPSVDQLGASFAGERGHGINFGEIVESGVFFDHQQEQGLPYFIHFVEE
jgi:hypothetical protein